MTKISGRILVDMDATLYYAPFAEACRVLWGADCPPTREVETWLWYEEYVNKKEWRTAVDLVHDRLGVYKPFPMAGSVLRMAKKVFYIIVTSQRNEKYQRSVDSWLASNKIPAHATVIRPDSKLDLFKEGDIVIDDAPHNIIGALERGAHAITLSYPYNEHTRALGAKHVNGWDGLGIILEGVIKNVTEQRPHIEKGS